MKIVIIGIGNIGSTLIDYLSKEGHDVVAIDSDPKVVEEIVNTYDVMGLVGHGISLTINKQPEIVNADVVLCSTVSDEKNMLCCLVAKKMGVKHTIARIRNPEFAKQFGIISSELGIDISINPESATAHEINRLIRFPNAMKVDSFAHGRVDLTEIKIPEGSILDNMKIMDISSKLNIQLLVCAVQRNNDLFIPNGTFTLQSGDRIHFIAPHEKLNSFFKAIKYQPHKLKNVLIFGGTTISYHLAKQLAGYGFKVTIVEKDKEICMDLSEKLDGVTIINGDPIDTELFDEENFQLYDASVALTESDEDNIMISLFAKQKGIEKTITNVSKSQLVEMVEHLNIDSAISPRHIIPNVILSYIRGWSNAQGKAIKTLYKIINDRVEAIEFQAYEEDKICEKKLKDIKVKKNVLIACISRGNEVIIPHGDDMILPNDNVIVVTTNEKLSSLDDILA